MNKKLLYSILTICVSLILSCCSPYVIKFPHKTDMKGLKILDTLDFKDFDFYRREELYTYPQQNTETNVGIHYILVEKSETCLHRVLNLVPIKPYRLYWSSPQYESNYEKESAEKLNLTNYIVYQMGYLHQDKIVFTNQRKKTDIVSTFYVDTTNNSIKINKVYYPGKEIYNVSELLKKDLIYKRVHPKVIVKLNPKKNCNIEEWDVADEFYITDKNILFKFLKDTCDKLNYFSFKGYRD